MSCSSARSRESSAGDGARFGGRRGEGGCITVRGARDVRGRDPVGRALSRSLEERGGAKEETECRQSDQRGTTADMKRGSRLGGRPRRSHSSGHSPPCRPTTAPAHPIDIIARSHSHSRHPCTPNRVKAHSPPSSTTLLPVTASTQARATGSVRSSPPPPLMT